MEVNHADVASSVRAGGKRRHRMCGLFACPDGPLSTVILHVSSVGVSDCSARRHHECLGQQSASGVTWCLLAFLTVFIDASSPHVDYTRSPDSIDAATAAPATEASTPSLRPQTFVSGGVNM
ncbi:hypothetical protein BJV78DRAFT_1284071 [Lactifluus subvellereus]|nr:hypothetical protein BJV78DRAFT_1284071 [Lactifluus subvellereus]